MVILKLKYKEVNSLKGVKDFPYGLTVNAVIKYWKLRYAKGLKNIFYSSILKRTSVNKQIFDLAPG